MRLGRFFQMSLPQRPKACSAVRRNSLACCDVRRRYRPDPRRAATCDVTRWDAEQPPQGGGCRVP